MKFLLDTNTLSELVRPKPSRKVLLKFQKHESKIAIASVVWHELLFGLARLPESRKKDQLTGFIWEVVYPTFPILPYESEAAGWHARERARLSLIGQTPSFADGQIAGIAATNGLRLVTRNLSDFANFEDLETESWH